MFYRIVRCSPIAKRSLSLKLTPSKCKPLVLPHLVYPTSLQYNSYNLLFLQNRHYSSAFTGPPEIQSGKDSTDPPEIQSEKDSPDPPEIQSEKDSNNEKTDGNTGTTNIALQSILDSDPIMAKRYEMLQLEMAVLRHSGRPIPENIEPLQWMHLLELTSSSAKRKYITYLFKLQMTKQNKKKKHELAKINRQNKESLDEGDLPEYGLFRETMFLRLRDKTIHHFYHTRLIQAMMFGPKIVIDCGYCDHMSLRESAECAKQLGFMFADNRVHPQPFDLHFCNADKSSFLIQKFLNIIPIAYNDNFPLNISECSYMELFDKDKLIYLTPHCNNEMEEYEPDSIYIVGALVDKSNSAPVSLAKAKKEGLRMAKLPLDKYLLWGSGSSKRFPLNHMIKILADFRVTNDWNKAFSHVPRRKVERFCGEPQANSTPKNKTFFKRNQFDKSEEKWQHQFSHEARFNRQSSK